MMKTQIELLVVLGVIGVLGVLFLPLLGRIQTPLVSIATCWNNLRQIGLSFEIWAEDHQDRLPIVSLEPDARVYWGSDLHKDCGYVPFVDRSVRQVDSALLPGILLLRGRTNHLILP